MHTRLFKPLKGTAELITGDFTYFSRYESKALEVLLHRSPTLVMMYDRDRFAVPVNERANWIRRHFNYHPKLEVRALYGAPAMTDTNRSQLVSYIQNQIPPAITVTGVRCQQPYSADLAKALKATYQPILRTELIDEIDSTISSSKVCKQGLLSDVSAARVLNAFKTVINEAEIRGLLEVDIKDIHYTMRAHNMQHPNAKTMFDRTPWDLRQLKFKNLPIIVGKVFTSQHQIDFSNPNKFQVFDMPIYMPGQGFKIPAEFRPILPIITRIISAEGTCNPNIGKCNAYITLDSGLVHPDTYARREGLHVDGFLTHTNSVQSKDGTLWGDNTYIVSDAEELQTEFYPGPFDLAHVDVNNASDVLQALAEQGKQMSYKQAHAYDIVKLTTNNVHAVHPNNTEYCIQRSFLKMTFSERLFNRLGNTINPHLQYQFAYVPRTAERNTQNFTGVTLEGYANGNLTDLDLSNNKLTNWVASQIFDVRKNPAIQISAESANEGDVLNTSIKGQIITTNIARAGDMKVTRIDGDSYFLSRDKFNQLYKKKGNDNIYTPTERQLKAVKVTRHTSFLASWGTRQNIPAGGFIVQDDKGDKWGVHEESFNATYLKK